MQDTAPPPPMPLGKVGKQEKVDTDDNKRLRALHDLNILDTPPEERFDKITRFATRLFQVPMSGITFVDKDRVWFKSKIGQFDDQIKRENSFEDFVINTDDVFVLQDARNDRKLSENEFVKNSQIVFYAGVPLKEPGGEKVGVFFIASDDPRELSHQDIQNLSDMASWCEQTIYNKSPQESEKDEDLIKAQQKLKEKNRELEVVNVKNQAVLDSIGEGVIVIDDKGEIIFVNHQVEGLTGYSEEELLGKTQFQALRLVDENDNEVPIAERPIRNAMFSKKKVYNDEYFYVRKDGSKFATAITATPIVLYESVTGGVIVFRDETKEREIDKMKTEFISLASHQLRTPLSAMKWFAEMLIDEEVGPLNEEQKEVADNIYQSNERMIHLVNTLLNISRIESGRIIIEPKPTDLRKLVDGVILELQPKIEEKNHNVAVSVHGELPKINVDPKLVRHVYLNLIANAVKYTPPGGEIVIIISKSGNEVISQISDNGMGIPKEQQDKVFSKFFRAKNVAKVVTEGTGLGLYLTKAIVDSSGGKIWFESEKDKGTTFWFILPLRGMMTKEGEVSIDT